VLAGANLEPAKDELGLPTGEDGILTAEEIAGLDLHATELVTLSACETGLGDVAAGEGVFGLERALHQAGARTVIASLWKVDDNAAQALMVEFYKNLWEKKLPKLEALRQAQLRMILDYHPSAGQLRGAGSARPIDADALREARSRLNHAERLPPFYWAAFTLSGDWR
jgi:CHAT domain-containing protein